MWWSIALGVCAFVVIATTIWILFWGVASKAPQHKATQDSQAAQQQKQPKQPQPVSLRSNTLFFGNVYWGRYTNKWSMESPLKEAYPFSRLNEFNRDNYDAWIAGLECPTVPGVQLTAAEEDATLSFNCRPEYLPQAAKWFTAFTLANNHTDNQGADGFAQTQQQLTKNKIQYFGHYDPDKTEDVCEVIALPATVTYDDSSTQKQALPVALCGYHAVFKLPSEAALNEISNYAQFFPVIVLPHMGSEYTAAPDSLKTTYYRAMIDRGADMVLGDHPHWIQSTEAYKGKLIVYSMGNFMFDQQDTTEVTRSAAMNVLLTTQGMPADQLTSWLKLAETCKAPDDTCLALAQQQKLQKITPQYTFAAIGTNDANKIVKPATDAQQAAILDRLKWAQTMKQLQPPQ